MNILYVFLEKSLAFEFGITWGVVNTADDLITMTLGHVSRKRRFSGEPCSTYSTGELAYTVMVIKR